MALSRGGGGGGGRYLATWHHDILTSKLWYYDRPPLFTNKNMFISTKILSSIYVNIGYPLVTHIGCVVNGLASLEAMHTTGQIIVRIYGYIQM